MNVRRWGALVALLAACGAAAKPATLSIDDATAGSGTGRFAYTGPWTHVTGLRDGRSNGTSSRTNRAGAFARLTFTGTGIRLYAVLGPAGGLASVMVDGGAPSEVDFHAMRITPHALVYSLSNLPAKTHTLTVSVEGQRNARSWGKFVNIDGAEIESAATVAAHASSGTHATSAAHRAPNEAAPHEPLPAAAATGAPAPPSASGPGWLPAAIAAAVLLGGGAILARRRKRATPSDPYAADAMPEPPALATATAQASPARNGVVHSDAPPPGPAWTRMIDPQAASDYESRLHLIRGLADRTARVDPRAFEAAYREEDAPEMRAAIIAAIRDGDYREASATVREALASEEVSLRVLAVGALARLGDYPAVQSALRDPSLGVATEAAYELASAQGMTNAIETVERWTEGERRAHILDLLRALS